MEEIPATQTAVIQDARGKATLAHGSPVPELRDGCVLVKTVAVALNPSDYKMGAAFPSFGATIGTDFAGRIVAMHGSVSNAAQLSIGDVVCGISHGSNPADRESGAFGQFILAQADLLLRVPEEWLPLHEAAALGTALFTACAALWGSLRLSANPERQHSLLADGKKQPVLVYGGSTACGTMAIQLLSLLTARPVFDYASTTVTSDIRKNTNGRLRHALDCITDKDSVACCYGALGRPGGRYSCLEYCKAEWRTRDVVHAEFVMSLEVLGKDVELGGEYGRAANPALHSTACDLVAVFQRLLNARKIRPHPVQIVGRGFSAMLDGLRELKSGSVSGKKLVVLVE